MEKKKRKKKKENFGIERQTLREKSEGKELFRGLFLSDSSTSLSISLCCLAREKMKRERIYRETENQENLG